jgi:site-specific DNA recombinase
LGAQAKRRRVATYERVSSEDQRERQTIKTQTEALARELDRDPDIEVVARYADDGVSGMVPMHLRPEGQRMLADAEQGLFDELWVYDLTRLARNTADAAHIRDRLEDLGIKVYIDGRAVDPFVYDVHAALAAEERRRIRKRSMDGANRAAAEGRYAGGIVPFGYRVEGFRPHARLVPDEALICGDLSAAGVVRRIYEWLAVDRWSCVRIAEELNALGVPTVYARDGRGMRGKRTAGVWRASRIRNLVVNTTYRGEYVYGKRAKRPREVISATVPRLVSDETWEAAQRTLKANFLIPKARQRVYLLRSVMSCQLCGLTYVGTTNHGATRYRCGGQIASRGKFDGRCPGKNVKGDELEPIVWADIEAWLRDPGGLVDELREESNGDAAAAVEEATRTTLRAALAALETRRSRRLDQHERGQITDSELEQALGEIEEEHTRLEEKLAALKPDVVEPLRADLVAELRARLAAGLTDRERQEIVQLLVEKIAVSTEIDESGRKGVRAVIYYRFCRECGGFESEEADFGSRKPHECPCGYYGDPVRSCSCPEASVSRYQRRVSGPLLDRLDLFVDVPRVEYQELTGEVTGERSEAVRARVVKARERQAQRLSGTPYLTNAEMGPLEVRAHCQEPLAAEAQPIISSAVQQLGLSARAYHRVLKVARTVADLAGSDRIEPVHLAEAIQYRRRGVD